MGTLVGRVVDMLVGIPVGAPDGRAPVGMAVGMEPEPHCCEPVPPELLEPVLPEQPASTPAAVAAARAIALTRNASGRWSGMDVLLGR